MKMLKGLIATATLLVSFSALSQVSGPQPELVTLSTIKFGDTIAAATGDGRFFAIGGCSSGRASLIYPNILNEIKYEGFNSLGGRQVLAHKSSYVRLNDEAATKICAEPNGNYTLQIVTNERYGLIANYVSGYVIVSANKNRIVGH